MRRAVLTLVLFLGFGGAVGAQTQQGFWSNLNRLKSGQEIEVIESSLKRHEGKFVTVTEELLTVKENGSDVSVKSEDVVRVSTSSGPKRAGHALIGLVAGGAIGAGIGQQPRASQVLINDIPGNLGASTHRDDLNLPGASRILWQRCNILKFDCRVLTSTRNLGEQRGF